METRLILFIGFLTFFAVLEKIWPRRSRNLSRSQRWPCNLGITIINSIIASLTLSSLPLYFAHKLYEKGLLALVGTPEIWNILISYIILDLAIYLQHILFHKVPLLWSLHQVHHSDPDLDVTSGFRFHPVEILLSLIIKIIIIIVLGIHPLAVFIFEISLNSSSLFNHSNINIRGKIDDFLRLFIVTPDMHRIHHSSIPNETNSNYTFTLSIWDKIFGTYTHRSKKSQIQISIGLSGINDQESTKLKYILLLPFMKNQNGEAKQNPR